MALYDTEEDKHYPHDNARIKRKCAYSLDKLGKGRLQQKQTKIARLVWNQTIEPSASVLVYGNGAIAGCRMNGGTLTVSGGGEVHRLVLNKGTLIVMRGGLVEDVELYDEATLITKPGGIVRRYQRIGSPTIKIDPASKAYEKRNREPIELAF